LITFQLGLFFEVIANTFAKTKSEFCENFREKTQNEILYPGNPTKIGRTDVPLTDAKGWEFLGQGLAVLGVRGGVHQRVQGRRRLGYNTTVIKDTRSRNFERILMQLYIDDH
jgi:hypothetical protein